ncbi:MAG: class II fructose-bisphosphate aldolase, partial [Spirochaetales bacterium]|nr:class II fructose-bisphosphate aldolase [Spirochaetales bacterium]
KIEQLQEVAKCGIGKINVDTDIRLAVTRNFRELFRDKPQLKNSPSIGAVYELMVKNPQAFDPRVFLPPVMDAVMYGNIKDDDTALLFQRMEAGVKEAVGSLIIQFGSYGKAPLVEYATLEQMAERYKKEGI